MRRLAACLLALVLVAGCVDTRETREPDVVVREATTPADETPARGPSDAVHLWVVTHGQAASTFWTIVRNGNLDTEAGAEVLRLLRAGADEGRAVVMVTHEAGATAMADRVLRLADGKLVPC